MHRTNSEEASTLLADMYTSDILIELRKRGVVRDLSAYSLHEPFFIDNLAEKDIPEFVKYTHSGLHKHLVSKLAQEGTILDYWSRSLDFNDPSGNRMWAATVRLTVVDTGVDNTIPEEPDA